MLSAKAQGINSRVDCNSSIGQRSVKLSVLKSILLHKMHFRNDDKVFVIGNLFETILPIPFCFLTLFILIYYIRRRCSLYQEIKRIPRELLLMQSYQNHLKNLSIMAIINNFIIAILLFELIQNISFSMRRLPLWVELFDKENEEKFNFLINLRTAIDIYIPGMNVVLVPLLSLLMNYLWWAYRKYEYKHLIFTWAVYILLRSLVTILLSHNFLPPILGLQLADPIIGLFYSFDFIQFIYYTRRFYLLLKSREQEIRLFYFDKRAYLDSRLLRIHFKISSILVVLSIFFYTVGIGFMHPALLLRSEHEQIYILITNYVFMPSKILSKMLINLNYIYIFLVIASKYFKNRKHLENINDNIRPLINKYHESLFSRQRLNYVNFVH